MPAERPKSNQLDSKPTRGEIQAKEITQAKKDAAFAAAMGFAGVLVERKLNSPLLFGERDILSKYPRQPKDVKRYLKVVILGRITTFHAQALVRGVEEAEALARFTELRGILCKRLSLCEGEVSDTQLNELIDERANSYLDREAGKVSGPYMDFVRNASAIVIPGLEAPKQAVERPNQALLD